MQQVQTEEDKLQKSELKIQYLLMIRDQCALIERRVCNGLKLKRPRL